MISFLLLLMAAAACCAPNSRQGSQFKATLTSWLRNDTAVSTFHTHSLVNSTDCTSLGEVNQTEFDAQIHYEYNFHPYKLELTKAISTKKKVTCNSTQHLAFKTLSSSPPYFALGPDGGIWFAEWIKCIDGQWVAKDSSSSKTYTPTEVACAGRKRQVPPTDKPKKRPDLACSVPPYSDVEITKHKVTCRDSAQQLFYQVDAKISERTWKADEITCEDRQWVAKSGDDSQKVEPTYFACVGVIPVYTLSHRYQSNTQKWAVWMEMNNHLYNVYS